MVVSHLKVRAWGVGGSILYGRADTETQAACRAWLLPMTRSG